MKTAVRKVPLKIEALKMPALRALEELDPVEACVLRVHVMVRDLGANNIQAQAGGFCLAVDWFVLRLGVDAWLKAHAREPRALRAAAPTGHLLESLAGDAMEDLSQALEAAGLGPIKMEAASEIGSGDQGLRATIYALAEAPLGADYLELAERAVALFLAPAAGLISNRDARWVGVHISELSQAREALEAVRLSRFEALEIGNDSEMPDTHQDTERRRL